MPYTVIDVEQRSPEWFRARLGLLTGSRAPKMMATRKDKSEAAPRRDLRICMALERVTGRSAEDPFMARDTDRGEGLEKDALTAYMQETGYTVNAVGFLRHRDVMAGCSPDGMVSGGGLVQVKCPRSANHFSYLRDGIVPHDHRYQLLHELWIAEQPWVDFVSYDPLMPENLQLFIKRMEQSEVVNEYILKARAFLREVDLEVEAINTAANLRKQLGAA